MANSENKQNSGNTSQKKKGYRFYKKKVAISLIIVEITVVQMEIITTIRVFKEEK